MRLLAALPLILSLALPLKHAPERGQQPKAAQTQQRGSDSLPVSVKLLNTGKSNHETAQDSTRIEREEEIALSTLWWTRALGIATIALAAITLLLWNATREMAADAAQTAKAAKADAEKNRSVMSAQQTAMESQANAANAMAVAAIASERAFVFLNTTATREGIVNRTWQPGATFSLYFVNLGKTPAQVEAMTISCRAWDLGDLETMTKLPTGEERRLDFWLGAAASTGTQLVSLSAAADRIEAAQNDRAVLGIVGRVTYRDIFDERHETAFALELRSGSAVYRVVQNPNLNYSR